MRKEKNLNIKPDKIDIAPGNKETIEINVEKREEISSLDRININGPPELKINPEKIEKIKKKHKIKLKLEKVFILQPSYKGSEIDIEIYNIKKGIKESHKVNIKYKQLPENYKS